MMNKAQKKWRNNNRDIFNEEKKRYYSKSARDAYNFKKQWTHEEDNLVLKHEISDAELAKQIGRSVQAIQIRRSRLNSNKA